MPQTNDTTPDSNTVDVAAVSNPPAPSLSDGAFPSEISLLTSFEFWLSVLVLLFGLVVMVIQYRTLRNLPSATPEDILRTYSVTLIVVGAMVFVTAAFDSKQIAPAFGLFGTIAGYLLGTIDRKNSTDTDRKN